MSAARARVVRLIPRPAPFEDALGLFRAASLEECVAALHGNETVAAAILRGRALMRLGRTDQAIATLEAAAQRAQLDGSSHVRGEVAMLLAAAHHRAGNAPEAHDCFSAARAYVWSTTDADLHSELARHVATMEWSNGNLDVAESHARHALRGNSPLHKALALELVGAIEASRGHLHTQAATLEEALELLEQLDWRDVWIESAIVRNLAILARDLQLAGVAERIERRVDSMPWTEETSASRYQALRHLGWCAAVAGDHLKAFRLLRQSSEHAPSSAWRVYCFLDRSFLAREMGERLFAAAELEAAEHLAERVDWDATVSDERCALLLLAELVAPHDAERAEVLIHRYRGIKRRMSVLMAQRDGHLRALESHAFGIVAAAGGRPARAADFLSEAFETWRSIGYVWRATRTALEMAELNDDVRYVEFAREHVVNYPNAWFARSAVLRQRLAAERVAKIGG